MFLKSPFEKLVGVVHGDGMAREQVMGAGPTDASEIVMLNRSVQWTEERIQISLDPRSAKEIIEEVGLEGAKPADTPNDCPQWGSLEILVKKAEGGVAFVVGK